MSTKIPWTNETWNFQGGCTPVSPGCLNCAAARSAEDCTKHWGNKKYEGLTANGKWTGELRFFPEELEKPLHWKKPRMVFPAFMSDLFHEDVPFEWIDRVMGVIDKTPQHTYQMLTKRPQRALEYVQSRYPSTGLQVHKNLWFGLTCENQNELNDRAAYLWDICAYKSFLSLEPLLSSIKFNEVEFSAWETETICDILNNKIIEDSDSEMVGAKIDPRLNWVIVGCESGPKRRECKLEWIKSIINQCKASDVSVFVKQIEINGKVEHNINKFPKELQYQEFPK